MRNDLKVFFTGTKEGFKEFLHSISAIINFILLFIVYIIGVGFTSILAKILNKHFLDKKIDKNLDSYWINIKQEAKNTNCYLRQF